MSTEETQPEARYISEEIGYWLKVRREANVGSFAPLEEAAKQVVVITSLLQGIYFAAISFSDIKQIGNVPNPWFNVFIAVSLITLIFWMLSLYFATRVFVPEVYNSSPDQTDLLGQAVHVRDAFDKIATYKHQKLARSVELLWCSFIPFAINIFIYLALLPAPPAK